MRPTPPPRHLRVAAQLDQLAGLRRFVEDTGAAWQIAPAVIHPLVLAVDELTTNTIVYGYRGQPGAIEVEMERTAEAVVVRLRDEAPPFDPTQVAEPDLNLPLEQRPVGGMGIFLARQSVDRLTHQVTAQGGNLLTLVKAT
jgi:serine/threonine-protein kinase RsbW